MDTLSYFALPPNTFKDLLSINGLDLCSASGQLPKSSLSAFNKPVVFQVRAQARSSGDVIFLSLAGSVPAIAACLCERSLTRVLGSVTLGMDKARKGA